MIFDKIGKAIESIISWKSGYEAVHLVRMEDGLAISKEGTLCSGPPESSSDVGGSSWAGLAWHFACTPAASSRRELLSQTDPY